MSANEDKDANQASNKSSPDVRGDREWMQCWHYGPHTVEATFAIRNGVEIPWAIRVDISSPDSVISLGGRNLLAKAHIIAEALHRNPILD